MDRKEAARALRNNPLLPEILDAVEADCVDVWKGAQTVEARELAHADIRAVNTLREQLDARTREPLRGDARDTTPAGDGD
jgi:hypothetical protein